MPAVLPRAVLFDAAARVAPAVPGRLACAAASAVSVGMWAVDRRRRRAVHDSLPWLVPALDPGARRALVRRTFRHLAWSAVDVLSLASRPPGEVLARVAVSGEAALDDALAEGRGVIVVAPHLGSWDVGAAWFAARGHRPCAVVERLPHGVFEVYSRLRRASGVEVTPLDRPRRLRRTLREGRVLILMADRVVAGEGRVVPFAGGRRALPTGPAALSAATGAPVVGAWIARDGWTRRYVAALERIPAGGGVEAMTVRIGHWLGQAVMRHPDQWFVFEPGWNGPVEDACGAV